ncbi:HDIG domain-containing protein [Fervidobacterium changbaicum]|uniref:HD domain-containing protein n=2 Tax=Fervidobacterium TaxID=2422 RepID=A0AAI8CK45_FERIS|nr:MULTISPECIES: HD domain-containing phosphohydrolase [Fervidobacterium]AMW31897.1 HD domain-containing protein [Fervidobacterium islandicum]QAV33672.1 HD domain-containing protein [Fervidobacterium changbaicum]SDH64926.1 HDIG domain-containing protein [Fervidobacterium changbaicum]
MRVVEAPTWLCGYRYNGVLVGRMSKNKVNYKNIEFYVLGDYSYSFLKKLADMVQQGVRINPADFRDQVVYIAAKLNSNLRLNELLKDIQQEICTIVNAQAASILMYESDHLRFLVTVGKASGKIESIPVPMESIAGKIFLEGRALVFNDLETNPVHFKGVDKAAKFKTENIVGSPIWVEDQKIGVIEVLNKDGGFTQEDAEIVELFAKLIGRKLLSTWRYEKFSESFKKILLAIATAIDKRDNYTHQHSKNVARISVEIGRRMGLNQQELEKLEFSAILHDVGKIGIPDSILLKPGKLTDEEYRIIKNHTVYGAEILSQVKYVDQAILSGALEHHERLDGSGYPNGKKGEEISLFGRIIGIADVYDALSSKRTYKEAWDYSEVLKIIESDVEKGKFSMDIFEKLIETVKELSEN